jgi:hypothetical protein
MGVPHGTPGEGVSAAIAHSLVFKGATGNIGNKVNREHG